MKHVETGCHGPVRSADPPNCHTTGCWGFLWLFETHGGIRVQENSEFATALKKTCEEKEKALIRHITGGIESSNGHNQQLFATGELH